MSNTKDNPQNHISEKLLGYFKDYEACHQTYGNEMCHLIGIPLIMTTLLGLLARVQLGQMLGLPNLFGIGLDGGTLFWLFATIYYLTLDFKLAIPFSFVVFLHYFVGIMIPLPWQIGIFTMGWIFQGIGHYKYEKKSPAFTDNILHIFIGPFWFFARGIKYYEK